MHITLQMVKEALHRAVAEKGEDHVAPVYDYNGKSVSRDNEVALANGQSPGGTCRYHDPADPDKPSCIAGNAFHQWGLLRYVEENISANEVLSNFWQYGKDVTVDSDGAIFLQQAQELQDSGVAWGAVVESLGI